MNIKYINPSQLITDDNYTYFNVEGVGFHIAKYANGEVDVYFPSARVVLDGKTVKVTKNEPPSKGNKE